MDSGQAFAGPVAVRFLAPLGMTLEVGRGDAADR